MQEITQLRLLRYLFSFYKYPRYFIDLMWLPLLQIPYWRRQGMMLGHDVTWLGAPIISFFPQSKILIGDRCVFCSRSTQTALGINHPVVMRTLQSGAILSIGKMVRMSGTTICVAKHVGIGDRCVIGANVTITDTDFHSLDATIRSTHEDKEQAKVKEVIIGSDVFIGCGSYILKGVNIGNRAVIGAGSVVSRDVAPGSIVAGNPAREVSQFANIYVNS